MNLLDFLFGFAVGLIAVGGVVMLVAVIKSPSWHGTLPPPPPRPNRAAFDLDDLPRRKPQANAYDFEPFE